MLMSQTQFASDLPVHVDFGKEALLVFFSLKIANPI